nr:DNA topoisomerase II large subunit [uncultured phage]CAI9752229.1 DNA topoisomerase II large subunit [uncultured phage]
MDNSYNSDSIKILSDLDHIRLRSGMYIGDNSNTIPLFNEAIDNAIDEVVAGYSDSLVVDCQVNSEQAIYIIKDTGRGIPTGYKEINGQKVAILEAIITKANSGGKFDSSAYLSSAGLNGVGLCCITALADSIYIHSTNNGVTGEIKIAEGNIVIPVEYRKTKEKSGTTTSFTVKKGTKYFDDYIVPYEYIVDKLNTYQAFGIKGIKFIYNGEDRTESEITAQCPFDLHKHPMDNGKNAIKGDIQVVSTKGERFRFAFNYIEGSSTSYKFNGYTNYLYNKDGGGHITAAQEALVSAIKQFCQKRNIAIPSDMNSDYFIGLNAIVSCNIIEKAFASQTKDRLITGTGTTRDYFKELVEKLAVAINEQVFDKNVGITKALVQRISDYRRERENRKELRGLSQYITINQSEGNTVRRGSVYEKLTECTSKNRDECELIMTEGDSASGAIQRKRNKSVTAVLPLRGKILNVTKVPVTKALQSKVIAGIISTVGTGILDKCNIDRIRYKDIYYCADPDDEGKVIINMVVALFVNLLPEVVKQGRLHIVVPPYYIYKDKNGVEQGVSTFEEIPKYAVDKGNFDRIKGLGSLTDEEVEKFLLNKEHRKFITVKYPENLDEFNRVCSTVEGKRELLEGMGMLQE